MKTLYIIRHAKSSWKHKQLDDLFRPLKGRGYRDSIAMGERLASRRIRPDLILSSPAVRAYSTSLILAQALRYDPEKIMLEPDIYETSTREVLEIVAATPPEVNHLFIVGHDPVFSDIYRVVTGEALDKIPTCGVVAVDFEVDSWNSILNTTGSISFYLKPEHSGVKQPE